jgi:type IX secretion system PorP/SprF family membrane protein
LALKFGVGKKYLDWSQLVFSDQLDPIYGNVFQTNANPPGEVSNLIIDASTGAVLRWRWGGSESFSSFGVALNHANRPLESFIGLKTRLPMRTTIHSYHHIKVSSKYSRGAPRYISSGVIFEAQQQMRTLNVGASITFGENMLVGLWYRNRKFLIDHTTRDALIFNATFRHNRFVLGYSYDMTNSELTVGKSHGTHEFNIGFTFYDTHLCKGSSGPGIDCYLFDNSPPRRSNKNKRQTRLSPWMYILP